MSDGFLTRWSRRKRLVEAEPDPPPETPEVARPDAAEPTPEPSEPEITPEELAHLPSPDELTAETDIAAFLRRGVPRALRDAALRRAWALDPKIRDFVCEAREYAYDWNVPGGVPGNGELLPTDDVAAMLRGIFGDPPPKAASGTLPTAQVAPPTAGQDTGGVVSHSREPATPADTAEASSATASDLDASQQDSAPSLALTPGSLSNPRENKEPASISVRDELAAVQAPSPETVATSSIPRRHGRATPI